MVPGPHYSTCQKESLHFSACFKNRSPLSSVTCELREHGKSKTRERGDVRITKQCNNELCVTVPAADSPVMRLPSMCNLCWLISFIVIRFDKAHPSIFPPVVLPAYIRICTSICSLSLLVMSYFTHVLHYELYCGFTLWDNSCIFTRKEAIRRAWARPHLYNQPLLSKSSFCQLWYFLLY